MKKPKALKLAQNLRIRQQNPKKAQKRVENALLANKMRAQQVANIYRSELQILDAALHRYPAGMQKDALLMNRGLLQAKFDALKIV